MLGLLDDDLARFTRGVEASGRRVHTLARTLTLTLTRLEIRTLTLTRTPRRVHTLALYEKAEQKPADVADPQAFPRLNHITYS